MRIIDIIMMRIVPSVAFLLAVASFLIAALVGASGTTVAVTAFMMTLIGTIAMICWTVRLPERQR